MSGKALGRVRFRSDHAAVSCIGENFIPHKMKTDGCRFGAIKKVTGHGFADVDAQFVPSVTLSEDVLGEAFRYIPAIRFLSHLKDDLIHTGVVYTTTA